MNFVFISPNFPDNYWRFCAELKKNGLRVLGIGDCPYDQLKPELRDSLHEYYKVDSLEDYDSVFRAVAFLTYKHGKIAIYLSEHHALDISNKLAASGDFGLVSSGMVGQFELRCYEMID